MRRYFAFALFLTVASGVLFGMQWYVASRTFALLSLPFSGHVTLAVAALTLLLPLPLMLSTVKWNRIVKLLVFASMIYLGALWIAFALQIAYHPLDWLAPQWRGAARFILPALWAVLVAYSLFNARSLRVREHTIRSPKLAAPLKIAHISDVHLGATHDREALARIVKRTNALQPDLVAITGDLLDGTGRTTPEDIAPLNDLAAPTFMVSGNHEDYAGTGKVAPLIATTKARLLQNQAITHDGLRIIGLGNIEVGRAKRAAQILSSLDWDGESFTLLLFHHPMSFGFLKKFPIDLHLSGHTHAGQIFPFNLLVRLLYPFDRGLHERDGRHAHVSPGTGTWGPPMRLGSRNEITLLRLLPR